MLSAEGPLHKLALCAIADYTPSAREAEWVEAAFAPLAALDSLDLGVPADEP